MPTLSELRTVTASDASFAMDRDDPSIGVIKFLTDEGWRKFQFGRGDLHRLAKQLREELESTANDQPEG